MRKCAGRMLSKELKKLLLDGVKKGETRIAKELRELIEKLKTNLNLSRKTEGKRERKRENDLRRLRK